MMSPQFHEIIGESMRHVKEYEKLLDRAISPHAIRNISLEEYDNAVCHLKSDLSTMRLLIAEAKI